MTKKNKGNICVGEEVRIAVTLALKKFLQTEEQKEFDFPSSLTSVERAYIHQYCRTLGLQSKSRGKCSNRYLTVYKKEGSTIVQVDAVFQLCRTSQQHAFNLLQRYPVSARERQELLPPAERDRILGQEARDTNRTTGRLSNGIPQVPAKRGDSEFQSFRQRLPIWPFKDRILEAIFCNQVVLVTGETGCGKTTQVPQFILDHYNLINQPCRIICTQPRRIAALSVAERVAAERDEKVGQTVGYQIRLESRVSPKTILTFCTNGVLLRTFMGCDAITATVTHIIVDEIHERDRFSDFLLFILRDLLLKFRNLKLVIMSATLDMQLFVEYFGSCPVIEVPGRLYKVQPFFLEDILKSTGYMTKAMKGYKSSVDKTKSQKQKLASWFLQPAAEGKEAPVLASSPSVSVEHDSKDFVAISDESEDLEEIISEKIELEPSVAAQIDEALQTAWLNGTEASFIVLLNVLIHEKISVDYQHSETSITALMIAAGHGNLNYVEQLLALGANVSIRASNDWTAIDWAKHYGRKNIVELLEAHCSLNGEPKSESCGSELSVSAEDKELLDIYHHTFNDVKVDINLILALLQHIHSKQKEGAILIFLPGYDDIVTLREKILSTEGFADSNRYNLFTLHSSMQSTDQKRIFKSSPPGIRKIILSTNIAETSITVNDIVYVIDSGKVKEKMFDSLTGVTSLISTWISKASSVQRQGRAGRCQPGICYHLFSRIRFHSLEPVQIPEILRAPLHEICLQAKVLAPNNLPIADFLSRAPDPPPFMVTRNAVSLLKTIDALDPWEELTELGLHLLDLPIEPHLAKMVLYSVVLKCLDPVLTIVSALAYKSPFLLPAQPLQKQAVLLVKKKLAADTNSDHMVLLRAFQAWQKARSDGYERQFCEKNFVSTATMEMMVGMRTQLLGQLRASGFVRARGGGDIRDLNSNSENWAVVKAALCAGTYPNVIRVDRDRKQLMTQKEFKVKLHLSTVMNRLPKSTNETVSQLHVKVISALPSDWIIYEEMVRCGSYTMAQCCTLVSPISVALFCGPARLPLDAVHEPDFERLDGLTEDSDSDTEDKSTTLKSIFKLDEWILFRVEPEAARLALQLRQKWHALFLRRMHSPSKPWSQVDEAVVRSVVAVLSAEEQALGLQQPIGIGQRPRPMSTDFCPPVSVDPTSSGFTRTEGHFDTDSGQSSASFKSGITSPHKAKKWMVRGLDDQSDTSSTNSAASGLSPCVSPGPSGTKTFHSDVSDGIGQGRKYFIIKANNPKVIELSFAKSLWAFTSSTERKLQRSFKNKNEVILIFSIQGSGHFQGYARFTGETLDQRPVEFVGPNLGSCYHIDWLKRANVPFQHTRNLQNPWNDNRKVQISRDGQEVEPSVGEALCNLWDKYPQSFANKNAAYGWHENETVQNRGTQYSAGSDAFSYPKFGLWGSHFP